MHAPFVVGALSLLLLQRGPNACGESVVASRHLFAGAPVLGLVLRVCGWLGGPHRLAAAFLASLLGGVGGTHRLRASIGMGAFVPDACEAGWLCWNPERFPCWRSPPPCGPCQSWRNCVQHSCVRRSWDCAPLVHWFCMSTIYNWGSGGKSLRLFSRWASFR